jgi:hypothetical protein
MFHLRPPQANKLKFNQVVCAPTTDDSRLTRSEGVIASMFDVSVSCTADELMPIKHTEDTSLVLSS